jgi:integrase
MWAEELESGKIKFVERYTNPLTGKYGRVSVVMEKNTASTRKVALEALNEKIRGKLEAINTEPEEKGLTLGKLKELYLAYQKKAFKLSTYRRNYYNLNTTIKRLGSDILVSSLSAGYIKQKMDTLNLENGSYNEYITRFKAMLRWGYENDLVADIRYLDKLKKLPSDTRREKLVNKYLEREELSALLKEMTLERWELLTEFLVLSGLRYGEACGLEQKDVSRSEQTIHVTKNYDYNNQVLTSTKTFTSTRDVFIQPELADVCKKIDDFFDTAGLRKSSTLFFPDRWRIYALLRLRQIYAGGQQKSDRPGDHPAHTPTHPCIITGRGRRTTGGHIQTAWAFRQQGNKRSVYARHKKAGGAGPEEDIKYIFVIKRAVRFAPGRFNFFILAPFLPHKIMT